MGVYREPQSPQKTLVENGELLKVARKNPLRYSLSFLPLLSSEHYSDKCENIIPQLLILFRKCGIIISRGALVRSANARKPCLLQSKSREIIGITQVALRCDFKGFAFVQAERLVFL